MQAERESCRQASQREDAMLWHMMCAWLHGLYGHGHVLGMGYAEQCAVACTVWLASIMVHACGIARAWALDAPRCPSIEPQPNSAPFSSAHSMSPFPPPFALCGVVYWACRENGASGSGPAYSDAA